MARREMIRELSCSRNERGPFELTTMFTYRHGRLFLDF